MKKLFTLIAAVMASSCLMMAQEWEPNVNPNSDCEGTDFTYWAAKPNKLADGSPNSTIFTGETLTEENCVNQDGRGKCITVLSAAGAAQDWDAQFWIVIPQDVEVGSKVKVSFLYKALWDAGSIESITCTTQAHGAPGDYHHWYCIGDVTFTHEWQVYEYEVTVTEEMVGNNGFHSIAFNLCQNNKDFDATFFFDDLEIYFEKKDKGIADGDYLIKNVATGKYLGGANSWGTQASLVDHGSIFTITKLEDGKYTLDSHTYNSEPQHFLGNGAYVDANAYGFNLYQVEGGVAIAIDENNAFGAPAEGSALATGLAYDDAAAAWEFIPYDQMIASLKDATETSPLDATFAIKAPNFNRNHYTKETYPWIVSDDCTNKNLQGGMNENMCAESYHSTFDIYQILTGMPNGVYALQAQGFYRADGEFTNTPVFYINEETGEFPVKTGSENSMNDASNSFSAGKYSINPIYVQVENGEIRLGVKNETETNLWCIWDNFELTYYGADANITDLKNAALIAKIDELLAEIKLLNEEYAETKMETSAKQALAYYADENNKPSVSNEEELNAAIETLTNVISNAKNSVAEYAQARKTADIYAKYAEGAGIALNMEDFDSNYENGTLSLEEGNPIANEYKAGLNQLISDGKNVTEDFIQNAGFETRNVEGWTAEGLHIAGNKNFPLMTGEDFVEMWTPGPGTLAEAKIEQTVTLPAGKYLLTAEAQLLQQGDATVTPEGFYLFAGDKQTWISNIATTFAVSFTLEEETEIALGAKIESCTGNWASIDNFQLFALKSDCDLTKEMFMKWDNYDATANPVGEGNGAYDFGVSTGLPYGDDMVFGSKFADLTGYSVLALTVTEGTPWLFFNRPGMGGHQPGYIEINSENSPYVIGVKENVWYIDLAKITVKDGYVHLNCIRGADWNYVTITEAKLYVEDNITTGINETFANTTQNGKFLQNGKIVIMKNGKAYTTTGTRILK